MDDNKRRVVIRCQQVVTLQHELELTEREISYLKSLPKQQAIEHGTRTGEAYKVLSTAFKHFDIVGREPEVTNITVTDVPQQIDNTENQC